MSRGGPREKGAVDLLEEATHLLRRTPADALLWYALGTFPFLLGLLFFWADMSRSAFARDHLAPAALGLALLFCWMKTAQAVFGGRLRALLAGMPPPPVTARRLLRLGLLQAAVAPWGLIALPAALLLTLPFGWSFAFFQNVTVGARGDAPLREEIDRARRQSLLWPAQNHLLLLLLSCFFLIVLAALAAAAYLLPTLARSLLGIDLLAGAGNGYFLNTTFWTLLLVAASLCLDPLVKALYLLRCFYGESLRSGEDLRAELQYLARGGAMLLLLIGFLLPAAPAASAPTAAPAALSATELDRALAREIGKLEYAWRLPREASGPEERQLPGFLTAALESVGRALRWLGEKLKGFFEWLAEHLPRPSGRTPALPGTGSPHLWFFFLLAAAAALAGILLYRRLRQRPEAPPLPAAEPAVPDLAAEEVSAAELPADRWATVGSDLLARGETRLGLRAYYLAILAHLAAAGLLTLAAYKSNRDYERELARRTAATGLLAPFAENRSIFERIWYGMHPAEEGLIEIFLANHRRILADGL